MNFENDLSINGDMEALASKPPVTIHEDYQGFSPDPMPDLLGNLDGFIGTGQIDRYPI